MRFHEQELLDLLFTDKSGVPHDTVNSTEMGKLVTSSRWKKYTDSVTDELHQGGFLDKAAEGGRTRLIIWGVVLMILSGLLFLGFMLANSLFGFWPLLLVGAVLAVGVHLDARRRIDLQPVSLWRATGGGVGAVQALPA